MRSLLVYIAALVGSASLGDRAHADPLAVTVIARTAQVALHRGEPVPVEVIVANTGTTTVTMHVMTCSWTDAWTISDRAIGISGIDCAKNFERTIELAPGATDVRKLTLVPARDAAIGPHEVKLGWSARRGGEVVWSAPLSFDVLGALDGVAVSAHKLADHRYALAIANTGREAISISAQPVLQVDRDGGWQDVTPVDLSCAYPQPKCVTLAPGEGTSAEWLGMTCGRCICHGNGLAQPGSYRLVARSCDGTRDALGAAFVVPAAR